MSDRIGDVGRRSERQVARRLGARLQPASGAIQEAKGDMTTPMFLVEAKATERDSYSLKLDTLAKVAQEALSVAKEPALTITFVTGDGRPRPYGRWVMLPERLFKELTDGAG